MRNFRVFVNGNEYEVAIEEIGASVGSTPKVQTEAVKVEQPKAQPAPAVVPQPAKASAQNGEKVQAPFPGVILKLLKAEGATVKKGEAILVLEAMKMENDIASPIDGVVSLKVQSGANVDTGALLAIVS